ncbi:MAG: response regulator [Anaerolineae bacterium]|nr:response regulator [Anaerolineae bacterium]
MTNNKKPVVVSVEDEEGIFELLRLTIEPLPVEFYHAFNGFDAIELIMQVKPDLLIMDIGLPDMNGWDVLKTIVAKDIKPNKILVLTAYNAPTHRLIAHLQDVDIYINKPFMPLELRKTVSELLELPGTVPQTFN